VIGGQKEAPIATEVSRVAAIYDIHGNLPALEAVLDEILQAGATLIVVGGDVVPGPMPADTIAALASLDVPLRFIHGNGDREVLAVMRGEEPTTVPERFRAVIRWNAAQLGPAHAHLLESWPATCRLEVAGHGRVLFCHATPRNDTEIFTAETPEAHLRPLFDAVGADVVVCGHTHMQFDRTIGRTRVVNAGSVGMPFGEPGAHWLLLGPDVELRHTTYDLARAADRIRRTAYPSAQEFADRHVLRAPSAREMLSAFAASALKG
jgi:putative phosphoesterase